MRTLTYRRKSKRAMPTMDSSNAEGGSGHSKVTGGAESSYGESVRNLLALLKQHQDTLNE